MTTERIEKTERLLNLTLALLATRKPMTKNEIFAQIPGYSGSAEAMERMFERDKDELRDLGIIVEVLPTDIYFEDEFGYQIIPRDFFLPELTLSFEESLWLALATNVISDLGPHDDARKGLQKLLTFGDGNLDEILEMGNATRFHIPINDSFERIWRAINEKRLLGFDYLLPDNHRKREVAPIMLTSRVGIWYLVAKEIDDNVVKTFRIDRMREISPLAKTSHSNPLPEDFVLDQFLSRFKGDLFESITLKLHKDLPTDHPLVAQAHSHSHKRDGHLSIGDTIVIKEIDQNHALEMILWAGSAVEVLEPIELRERIITILKQIVEVHS